MLITQSEGVVWDYTPHECTRGWGPPKKAGVSFLLCAQCSHGKGRSRRLALRTGGL